LWHKELHGNNALYEINAINEINAFYEFYAIYASTFREQVLVVRRCKLEIAWSEEWNDSPRQACAAGAELRGAIPPARIT
jgi:hypothetical protein